MKIIEKLEEMFCHTTEGNGAFGRTERLRDVSRMLLSVFHGTIVEIGAGYGQTTVAFLHAAIKFDGTVIVIDPWLDEFDGGKNGYKFEEFCHVMDSYVAIDSNYNQSKHLFVARVESQSPEANGIIHTQTGKISLGFVDGLQTVEAVLSDIRMLAAADAKVICVDDIGRTNVEEAVVQFKSDNTDYLQYTPAVASKMETYLALNIEM